MKTRTPGLGLSILAGGLSFVGSANAIDLINNGSFENSTNGWQYFSRYSHSSAYYSGVDIPVSENRGTFYGWRPASAFGDWDKFVTPTNESDHLTFNLKYAASQVVSLTNALTAAAVDAGQGQYTFSCWLASYGNGPNAPNPEQPYVVLRFFDDSLTTQVGGNVIFDRAINNLAVTYANGNTSIPADLSADHDWIKYATTNSVPAGARKAKVYLTRSPRTAKSFSPDTYMDLIKLNVINITETTLLDNAIPSDGQTDVNPGAVVTVTLRDLNTQVNTNTIQLSFDGSPVIPGLQKSAGITTVTYDPPGLLAPLSTHTYRIVWSDNGGPVTTKTNQFAFTVAAYFNIVTGPAVFQETFDGVAEGSVPAGWTQSSSADVDIPGLDINNFHSDSYTNWIVISRSTLSNLFPVVPGGTFYTTTVNVAPLQFINGAAVTNLITTNFAFAASAARFGDQVQNLTTSDYNLSGKNGVFLLFKSIYAQNEDSMGAVEYSIDGGSTWLPALYMLDGDDVIAGPGGTIDASNTFAAVYLDVPPPGNYGAFIGLAQNQWASAAAFISPRVNDDLTGSMRPEWVRLAQADNHATVRVRFTQVGENSWYFGIDEFGLYSITATNPPVISGPPASQTVAAGNAATLSVSALGPTPLSYQWRHAGTNLPASTGPALVLPVVHTTDGGAYDVIVSYAGLSATSSPPATLTVINPAVFVTGQWDFPSNLTASCGTDLQYFDASVQANSSFGTTTSFGIANINGTPATVMKFTPTSGNSGNPGANNSTAAWGGYKMFHGVGANGGGAKVNQYTVIYDILYPTASDLTWRALLQADTVPVTGGDDSEFYINQSDGVGISVIYHGNITPDVWHRVALAVDLSGPGTHPVVTKFIDGVKVGEQTAGLSTPDGRFSLSTTFALLLAENNGYNNDGYVSSIQINSGRRPDEFIQALGGATASKIPGCIKAILQGGNVQIRWTGNVSLQGADDLNGPWSTVSSSSPYNVPSVGGKKYYRPKILRVDG